MGSYRRILQTVQASRAFTRTFNESKNPQIWIIGTFNKSKSAQDWIIRTSNKSTNPQDRIIGTFNKSKNPQGWNTEAFKVSKSHIRTQKPLIAQKKTVTYAKSAQHAQKQSHIRTQKPHNVRKIYTKTYAKAVFVCKRRTYIYKIIT